MLDGSLPTTLQHQLKTALEERISRGDWAPGAKISSEREICEEFGVSRITVREAVKDLVAAGLLVPRQGKGTFVAQPKYEQKLGGFYSFSTELEQSGLQPSAKMRLFSVIGCPKEAAEALELPRNKRVYLIKRLRLIGEDLFALESSYVPCHLVSGLTQKLVQEHGLYGALRKSAGLQPDEAEESFEAVGCPPDTARLLGLEAGSAVLHLIRLARARGVPVEYCDSIIRGDKYRYKVVLK